MIPSGVQGRRPGTPASNRPWLIAVRPSTSFSGAIAWMTASLSMPLGSGSWTRMPWTSLRAFSPCTTPTSSAVGVSPATRCPTDRMPTSTQARSFEPT